MLLIQSISEDEKSTAAMSVFQCKFQHKHSAHNSINLINPYVTIYDCLFSKKLVERHVYPNVNYTIFVVHTVSFVCIDFEMTTPGGVHWQNVSENDWFPDLFWRGEGYLPSFGANHTYKPYIEKLQILSSLCMQRYDFDTTVKGATPEQLRDRAGSAFLKCPFQSVCAAGLQLVPLIYPGI